MKELIEKKLANARADLEKTQEELSEARKIIDNPFNYEDDVLHNALRSNNEILDKINRLIGCIETYEDLLHTKELSEVETKSEAWELISQHLTFIENTPFDCQIGIVNKQGQTLHSMVDRIEFKKYVKALASTKIQIIEVIK